MNKANSKYKLAILFIFILCFFLGISMDAHGVDANTKSFLMEKKGVVFGPFLYIGAKHMITGYNHLLFLVGVIFFLYKPKEIILYVSFFAIGHSSTLLFGVMADIQVNAYLIDAITALSIVYKRFRANALKKINFCTLYLV